MNLHQKSYNFPFRNFFQHREESIQFLMDVSSKKPGIFHDKDKVCVGFVKKNFQKGGMQLNNFFETFPLGVLFDHLCATMLNLGKRSQDRILLAFFTRTRLFQNCSWDKTSNFWETDYKIRVSISRTILEYFWSGDQKSFDLLKF
jgi:hypothetical protein